MRVDTKSLRELAEAATPENYPINRHMRVSVPLQDLIALLDEVEMLRNATERVVALTPDNCDHNREIDPDTGECADCGTVLP